MTAALLNYIDSACLNRFGTKKNVEKQFKVTENYLILFIFYINVIYNVSEC